MLNPFTRERVSASVWPWLAGSRCCGSSSCSAGIWLLGSFAQGFMRRLWSCLWIWIVWIFRLAGLHNSRHHFLSLLIMRKDKYFKLLFWCFEVGCTYIYIFLRSFRLYLRQRCWLLKAQINSSKLHEQSGYSRLRGFWALLTSPCPCTLVCLSFP